MVKLTQNSSSEYSPRTYYNVSYSDVTVAMAINFETAGEKLTHTVCGKLKKPILQLSLHNGFYQNAQSMLDFCRKHKPSIINVAGNGIYTLNLPQETVNKDIYQIISRLSRGYEIGKIMSGGQTGVDWAAGVVANVLGINCVMTFPFGYKQRGVDGVDFTQANIKLRQLLVTQTKQLEKHLNK